MNETQLFASAAAMQRDLLTSGYNTITLDWYWCAHARRAPIAPALALASQPSKECARAGRQAAGSPLRHARRATIRGRRRDGADRRATRAGTAMGVR